MTSEALGGSWVPEACTLPTAEQPLRVAEFDGLFAEGLLGVERQGPTELELVLKASCEVVARELVARESECCSFFGFVFSGGDDGELRLRVSVPVARVDVLDGLAARAAGVLA
ncbi:hypothetical protein [Kribbella italica]|uniref:Uncharacterized protein n=1 Tax=Kribbella italica TaxID=1540520 RepID=A0A7W9JCU7_9ACTN|nr:hypothetical protein [Kribbella italica]MBB5839619.1 hypothetical protein [Kribbella italica]